MEKKMLKEDFIGKPVEVSGIHGTIADETKNLFIIRTNACIKKVEKKGHEFIIMFNDKKFTIPGNQIIMRPEERIKLR